MRKLLLSLALCLLAAGLARAQGIPGDTVNTFDGTYLYHSDRATGEVFRTVLQPLVTGSAPTGPCPGTGVSFAIDSIDSSLWFCAPTSLGGTGAYVKTSGSGGGGATLETNGLANANQSILNLQSSAAFNGLTLTFTYTGGGGVQLGASGALGNGGLANSSVTVNGTVCTLGASCSPTNGPAGSNTQVQFNSAGALGADTNFTWDNTNKVLGVGWPGGATGYVVFGVPDSSLNSNIQNWANADSNHVAYTDGRVGAAFLGQWTGVQTPAPTVDVVAYNSSSTTPSAGTAGNEDAALAVDGLADSTSNTITYAGGVLGRAADVAASGTLTNAAGVLGYVYDKVGSTITNAAALKALSLNAYNTSTGALTNAYGLLVEDQTGGTNNWAIKTGLGQVQLGVLAGGGSNQPVCTSNTGVISVGGCGGGSGTVTSATIAGTANQVTASGTCTITTSGTCTLSLPNGVVLGTDNSAAGTLQLANPAANAHTIFASGATTTNTIKGFAAVPTNLDLVYCAVVSTTCTLTDSGVAFNTLLSNPATTLGDLLYENATPALARLPGPTTPNGVPQILVDTPTGGAAAAEAWALAGVPVNNNSETTCASYTLNVLDRATAVFCSGGSTATITMPVHTTSGFGSNFPWVLYNGNSGILTLTPTTDTIDSGSLASKWADFIYNNSSGNWQTVQMPTANAFTWPATGTTLGTVSGTLTSGCLLKGNGGVQTVVGDLQDSSNQLNSCSASTQAIVLSGGQDVSANSALGGVTLRGANETGAGGSSSAGGGALVEGGTNAGTNAASLAGSVQLLPGASTGATQGLQGVLVLNSVYVKGATVTQWNLECESAAMTVTDCGATPNTWLGVAEVVNSNTAQLAKVGSQVPINASASVTLGHTVCAGSTAGKVTDSGGTSTCSNSQGSTVGIVMATSGAWTLPDGTTFTASATLPLVELNTAVVINTAGGGSGTVNNCGTSGGVAYYASTGTAVSCLATVTESAGALALGTDNSVAGTVTTSNSAANAHTIWGSGATTTNTILGFATVPTTGDLASCTVSSTTCTLTDSGVLAANVVTAASAATAAKQLCVASGASKTCSYIDFPQVYSIPTCYNGNGTASGVDGTVQTTVACTLRAGTNNKGAFYGPFTTSDSIIWQVHIPADADLTNFPPYVDLDIASTDSTNGHTIIMQEAVECAKLDLSTTDDVAFNAARSLSTITLNGNANRVGNATITLNSTDMTGCAAPGLLWVKITRTTDTASNVELYNANLTIPRLLTVQAN